MVLMLDVAGIDAELLTSENTVTINVLDVKNAYPSPGLPGFRGTTNLSTTHGRAVTVYRDTLSEGFSHFVTSTTLRLLSAGGVAGWALHPLESAAFSRRTPNADLCNRTKRPRLVNCRPHTTSSGPRAHALALLVLRKTEQSKCVRSRSG